MDLAETRQGPVAGYRLDRKHSIARVQLKPGRGQIIVNGKECVRILRTENSRHYCASNPLF